MSRPVFLCVVSSSHHLTCFDHQKRIDRAAAWGIEHQRSDSGFYLRRTGARRRGVIGRVGVLLRWILGAVRCDVGLDRRHYAKLEKGLKQLAEANQKHLTSLFMANVTV